MMEIQCMLYLKEFDQYYRYHIMGVDTPIKNEKEKKASTCHREIMDKILKVKCDEFDGRLLLMFITRLGTNQDNVE